MKVLVYRKCSTCMKALKWLDEHNINYEERAIKEENPTYDMIPPDQLANVNPEQLEALRESYGLNDPFLLRYVRWLGELLHGNFGYSITSGVPIKDSPSSVR